MPAPIDSLQLKPVSPTGRVAPLDRAADPRQEALARALQPMLGKTMQAEILSRLSDGSAVVRVAGHAARMPLPPALPSGSQVALTLVAVDPRPAFQLGAASAGAGAQPLLYPEALPAGPGGAAPSLRTLQAAALLGRQALVPADQLPPEFDSSPTQLSDTARVLSGVLALALKTPNAQTAVVARTPLVAGPQVQPEQVAAALKDAIGASGLFYESHVAEWAGGKRPLPELLREPQLQKAMAAALAAPEPGPRQAGPVIDTAAAQMINLQLATQEQGRIVWQGQVWPGQHMEWEIEKEDDGKRGGAEDEDAPSWRSGVRFRFPLLGEVAGSVILEGGRLHIQLRAGSDASSALLRRHAAALGAALEAAGTPLSSLDIHAKQQAGDG